MKESTSLPKKTSTNENWAHECGTSLVKAMLNMDWDNPPKKEPRKPLFPPKEKK